MKAESFITALNGVITGKHHGDMEAELYGTPYYGHEKIIVPFEASIVPLEPVNFYTADWKRKSDCCLIKEGLLPMPKGYVQEKNDELRPMTQDERVIAGLDEPQPGFKVENGDIVPMTMPERVEAGQLSQKEYEQQLTAENESELQRRLAELQTPKALAQAEIDAQYAAGRKAKLAALLAVEDQKGWPLEVDWPS
jgi:hypothetical protein